MSSEAVPAIIALDDHARGCQGREYACTCGYDDRVVAALVAQEAEMAAIKRREAQLIADCAQELREAYADYLERAEAAEAEIAALRMALRTVRRALCYPVSTDINPKGWAWHVATDGQDFVIETIDAALAKNVEG